jgi:quinol monooxygenase YgiN
MLTFIGVGHFQPGKMDQVVEAVQAVMPKVRSEPGTIEYVVYRGVEDRNLVVFFEQYQDAEAQAAHMASDAVKALLETCMPLLAGEPTMGVVEVIASAR